MSDARARARDHRARAARRAAARARAGRAGPARRRRRARSAAAALARAARHLGAPRAAGTLTVAGYRESGGVATAIARTADARGRRAAGRAAPAGPRGLPAHDRARRGHRGHAPARADRRAGARSARSPGVVEALLRAARRRAAGDARRRHGRGGARGADPRVAAAAAAGSTRIARACAAAPRELGHAARLWEAGGREPSDLYRGARLGAAATGRSPPRELNATERAFLDAGAAEADRERLAETRANRRLRGLLAGTAVLLVVALVAGVLSLVQRDQPAATPQSLTSDAERVGALALSRADARAVAAARRRRASSCRIASRPAATCSPCSRSAPH